MPAQETPTGFRDQLGRRIKAGLIRELYQKRHITQAQFTQLMELQRGR